MAKPRRLTALTLGVIGWLIILVAGCQKTSDGPVDPVTAGRMIYLANCSSCHNANPREPGSVGPAIAGSPRALISARVLHQGYPPSYTPKRQTHLMRQMPWLAPQIDNLTAYLKSAANDEVTTAKP
jgi:mono/diheme cytochrome c family protein